MFVGPKIYWHGGRTLFINNFATDPPIFTIGLSSRRVLVKEVIAGVAKFRVFVSSTYSVCVYNCYFAIFCFLFALLHIVDCVSYFILSMPVLLHDDIFTLFPFLSLFLLDRKKLFDYFIVLMQVYWACAGKQSFVQLVVVSNLIDV